MHPSYERKKPVNLIGLLNEPLERLKEYSWLTSRLLAATPVVHPDYKEVAAATESFQRELSGFHSELEMMKMTATRLQQDKEELVAVRGTFFFVCLIKFFYFCFLFKRLSSLSIQNDSLNLARNNHELQRRELTEANERQDHKMRTLSREVEQLRERNLQAFLDARQQIIGRRRAENLATRACEEASVLRIENKRLETELSVARSMKLFRDVTDLRAALSDREKQLLALREELQKTKEAQILQTYTDAHIRSVESENVRLSKRIEELQEALVEAVRLRHAPLDEEFSLDATSKDECLLASDGSVRGGTVQGLVSALVRLEGGKEITDAFMNSFFLTYRVFITPIELQLRYKKKGK